MLRRVFSSDYAVRLPALPRRITIFVLLTLLSVSFFLTPVLLVDILEKRLNQSLEQAAMLAQISDMHSLEGRRPEQATQALPLVGFDISTAEAPMPMRVWLVRSPPPSDAAMLFDMRRAGFFDVLQIAWAIVTCPPEAVFAIRNADLQGAMHVTALSTFELFQMTIFDALQRIVLATIFGGLVLAAMLHIAVRRLLLGSLDDLFIRLYGNIGNRAVSNDPKSLRASLDNYQERMREHVDEQARLASLGAGASFLAHDMRNLLASLTLNAEQLQNMSGEKEQRIGRRLSAAIEQAMSLAEWAALYTSDKRNNLQVELQPLRPIIADALNFARLHDPKRRIELVNQCPDEAVILAEETLLFRVVYNLVLNAMQAMKAQSGKKQVRISAASDDEKCEIIIADTGPGLPGGKVGTLLMPHVQGFGRPDGTGLGLKIVVDLLSWHGGRIELAQADAHGTAFKITLPHASPGAPRDEEWAPRDEDGSAVDEASTEG